jgi:hypothetical protein
MQGLFFVLNSEISILPKKTKTAPNKQTFFSQTILEFDFLPSTFLSRLAP